MNTTGNLPSMGNVQRPKIRRTMHEYKAGTLHSGSSDGQVVRDPKQAIAIALGQARREKKGGVGIGIKRRQ